MRICFDLSNKIHTFYYKKNQEEHQRGQYTDLRYEQKNNDYKSGKRVKAAGEKRGIKTNRSYKDFPGGPVARTPCFHCRGHRFDPWLGN